MRKGDFRIVEYNGVFTIERLKINYFEKGFLWWKRWSFDTEWRDVNLYGDYVECIGVRSNRINELHSLDEAKKLIGRMVKGKIIHYC